MPDTDIESLRSEVADLRRRVSSLEQQTTSRPVLAATTASVAPSTSAMKQAARPQKAGQPRFIALRIIAFFLGVVWLLGGLAGMSLATIVLAILVLVLAIVWPFRTGQATAIPSATSATHPHVTAAAKPHQRSALEIEFAEHWLSWLGILSLVVGISFMLQYAFRGFGPWGNILTAYATALMLFGLWAYFAKRFKGFAFILQSGAWATVFLTTLSIRSVNGGSLLPAPLVTLALLAVTAAMIVSAMMQHSRTLTGGAFMLGYVAALTGPVDSFTLTAFLGLAVGLALVSALWSWPELIVIGNLLAYFANGLWFVHVNTTIQQHLNFGLGMLIAEALIFGAAHWISKHATEKTLQTINLGAAVNLAGFFILFNGLSQVAGQEKIWVVSGFLTIVCGLLALAAQITPSRKSLRVSYLAFMSAFLTMTIFQKLHGDTAAIALLAEAVILSVAGIYGRLTVLRWCGYVATVFSFFAISGQIAAHRHIFAGLHLSNAIVLGGLATVGYLLVAWMNRRKKGLPMVTSAFVDAALVMALASTAIPWPAAWQVSIWAGIGLITVAIGNEIGGRNARLAGNIILIAAILAWLSAASSTAHAGALHVTARLLSGLVVIAALAAAGWKTKTGKAVPAEERLLAHGQWWGAVVMMTMVLGIEVATNWLSVAWGIEGMILVIAGLGMGSRTARRQGLSVLILTIAKVYLYDIQSLPPFARILSFIILGCLLLGVGYWYNRSRKLAKATPPPTA